MVALENETVIGQRRGFSQARVEDADGGRVEAAADGQDGEQCARGEYREDVEEDLGVDLLAGLVGDGYDVMR